MLSPSKSRMLGRFFMIGESLVFTLPTLSSSIQIVIVDDACSSVEVHFGELFPRARFIVTTLETPSRSVVRFHNKRGTAEQ